MIIFLLIIFAIIAYINVPPLIRKKHWRDLIVYLGFYAIALTLSILLTLNISIPSPIKGIQYVIKDILHLNYK